MDKKYPVKEFMKHTLITFEPEQNIFEAIDKLIENKISGAPVVDRMGRLIGILTEKDCLELVMNDFKGDGMGQTVSDFLTKDTITIDVNESIIKVANLFLKKPFRRLPVLDQGKLIGVVSRRDVLTALQHLSKTEYQQDMQAEKGKTRKKASATTTTNIAAQIKKTIKSMNSMKTTIRPKDKNNKPGGLIEFGKSEKREFIIVGDLHANYNNLKTIVEDNEDKLEKNQVVIILIGDLFHNNESGKIVEMDSSLEMIKVFLDIYNQYPSNIIYLLGNHDSFSPLLSKRQVQQGKLFKEAVTKTYGDEVVELMQRLFDSLPLFVKHPYFLAMHAGPIRGGATKEELVNIRLNDSNLKQLTWNRINELGANPSSKEYGKDDLDDIRKKLKTNPNTPIIVGHNPLWGTGDKESVWTDVIGCKQHVIVYSNQENVCPYVSVKNSYNYEIVYANLEIAQEMSMNDYFKNR
ncbi:MAG: CBS domain-containing protein [Spirochaetes bacterium]|nr:CBS domain-containing protein [Spirochaetota bacterium]